MRSLGSVGIWSRELRFGDPVESIEAAVELEELGYGALWIPGGSGGTILDTVRTMLAATSDVVVATESSACGGTIRATSPRLTPRWTRRSRSVSSSDWASVMRRSSMRRQEGLYRKPLTKMRSTSTHSTATRRPARARRA